MNIKYKTTKEQLETIARESLNIAEVCRKLGIIAAGGNYKTVKTKIQEWGIDTSHFTGQGWNTGERFRKFSKEYSLEEALVEHSPYKNNGSLKRRLITNDILEYKCDECGIELWLDNPIVLELDHINGNNRDNRLENLRLLCPNCHSQTSNFRGKNIQGRSQLTEVHNLENC